MCQHQLEGVLAGLFAEAGEQHIASDQGLQTGPDGTEDRARAYYDATYYAEIAHDLVVVTMYSGTKVD